MKEKFDYNKKEEKETNNFKALKIIYLIILIILLIFTLIVSFKTGEGIYYLVNTNQEKENFETRSDVATWHFDVKIMY